MLLACVRKRHAKGSVMLGQYLALTFLIGCLTSLTGCSTDLFESGSDAGGDALGMGDAAPGDSSSLGDGGDAGSADASGDASDGFDGYVGPLFRRVFITSAYVQADFGGVAGGDVLCNTAASSASLGGTWVSWTSTSGNDVASRMTHSLVPYKLLDGTLIAPNWTDLTSGTLSNPINRDEHGNLVALDAGATTYLEGVAWTATQIDGTHYTSQDCASFTTNLSSVGTYAVSGYDTAMGSQWTLGANIDCNYYAALYCFEQ
jgi:hypothetical protein